MKTSDCTCKTITDCFGLNELLLQSWTCYRKIHFCLWVWSLMKPGWLRQVTFHSSRRHWSCILLAVLKLLQAYRQCSRPDNSMPVLTDTAAHHHWNTERKHKKHLLELWTWSNSKHFLLTPSLRLSSVEQFPTGRKIIWAKTGWRRRRMSVPWGNIITIEQTNFQASLNLVHP